MRKLLALGNRFYIRTLTRLRLRGRIERDWFAAASDPAGVAFLQRWRRIGPDFVYSSGLRGMGTNQAPVGRITQANNKLWPGLHHRDSSRILDDRENRRILNKQGYI